MSTVVIVVVAFIALNKGGNPPKELTPAQETNNINEAIASQFNDNIRDVSARLIATEKKLHGLESSNKALAAKMTC